MSRQSSKNEEAEGSRADEELRVSEQSVPHEKTLNNCPRSLFQIRTNTFNKREAEKENNGKRMKSESTSGEATDRGNKFGAVVRVGV